MTHIHKVEKIECEYVANCIDPTYYKLRIRIGTETETCVSLCHFCWEAIKMQAVQDIINEALRRGMRYSMWRKRKSEKG